MNKHVPTRVMRDNPDLDQLKRQAKDLLRAFGAGDQKAVVEVNAHYHDADPAAFALHDAQLVIARAYGFDSWPKLKAYVDGVTITRFLQAIELGDLGQVQAMLKVRPELINMEVSANNEHRPLHSAVLMRSAKMVRYLMEHGADARKGIYPHRDATSPLTIARERSYDEIVSIILEEEQRRAAAHSSSADIASQSVTDLLNAIQEQDARRVAEILTDAPELVNACDRNRRTPLHLAAAARNPQMVSLLLARGAKATANDGDGRTPLDYASMARWWTKGAPEKFAEVAKLLQTHGAELSLMSAVALGDEEWLRTKHGRGELRSPDVLQVFEPPQGLLTIAVEHDRFDMVRLLLDFGFDPDERMRVEQLDEVIYSAGSPLWHCARSGKHDIAELLLERGADPNATVYASGSVMYSAYAAEDDQMVALLERYGGIVDAATAGHQRLTSHARRLLALQDAGDLPPGAFTNETLEYELLWAGLRGGDPEIVRMALERIDWPTKDSRWKRMLWSPLPRRDYRSPEDQGLYLECFQLVLQRCGDPNIANADNGRTMLHDVAALDDSVTDEEVHGFATVLLTAGARLDIRDKLLKSSPLGWACRYGRLSLVRLLLDHGADPAEPDAEPWATPLAWAEKKGHSEVVATLLQHSHGLIRGE